MALISGGILVLMWILGHDFSGHYNRLALISVDIKSRVYFNRASRLLELLLTGSKVDPYFIHIDCP